MCFVVFCGVLRVFCDVLRVFCGVLRVFCSISHFHKTPKTLEKHRKKWKTKKTHNTLVYCGRFPRAKNFDCIAQNTFHKTSAKHRKTPQNTAKQSQNAFCEITSQNTAKQTQNAQDCHINGRNTAAIRIARIRCILKKYVGSVAKAHNTQYTRKLRGGAHTRRGSRSRIVDVFQKQCFAVFCGVLWCFAVFCVRVFSVFHKTAQNRPTIIQNAQNEQNTLCAIQRITVLCIFLSLRKCLQK